MVHVGAAPVTWLRVVLELRRGRVFQGTAMEVQKGAVERAGVYGQQGRRYVVEMFAVGGGSRAS